MRNFQFLLVIAVILASGFLFIQNFQIEGLDRIRVGRGDNPSSLPFQSGRSLVRNGGASPQSLRIASFHIQVFGATKVSKPHVMQMLANICGQFDLVAIQDIRSADQSTLPRLVDLMNANGPRYDYVIGPRVGRGDQTAQFAYVFDAAKLEVDRHQLYTLADPDDQLFREPLVAWFRVRGVPPEQAFTFTLVNVHSDPYEAGREADVLDDVFNVIRDDGRNEDDLIMLGDFNRDAAHLGQLGAAAGIQVAVVSAPTDTRGTQQFDNLVFSANATTEFTGRSGVFDFMREFNLSLEEALEVSDHMPVWAEFTIYEGGEPGRIASQASDAR